MARLWYEDFEIGKLYHHPVTRTVTETDNILFSTLTHNAQALHIDRNFAAGTEWGQPLMNSFFTLSLMVGISVNDLTLGTTIANPGMTEVKFPGPLFQGDTINVTTEVISKRESKSRPDSGIVELTTAPISRMVRLAPNASARLSCASGPLDNYPGRRIRQTSSIVAYSA